MSDEMSAKVDNSRIVSRLVPSLSHMAALKIAAPLFLSVGMESLETVFAKLQQGNPRAPGENSEDDISLKSNRAKEHLLFIPGHLREHVLNAVKGLHNELLNCRKEHSYIGADKCSLHLRPDGTIDRRKIAQELVADMSLDIRKRFHIACTYHFTSQISTLWAEMQASGHTENFDTAGFHFKVSDYVRERIFEKAL
ncbi:hypothetical protein AVEN_114726-1 [Araneus ventricosus]|uniref:Uncharacterized protein n=1 Tax=Araneus ventricosus TaxID=182803 RepID=A0A4Y2VRM8_ARAVE|nr:hypothetical protein AVEN_114726-1 [Araneus ventricosus]